MVPLRRRHEEIGDPFVFALLIVARGRELLVMHNLAAVADTERAAFFAARCRCADVSVQRHRGVSDPGLSPSDFAPRLWCRGSLTPSCPSVRAVGAGHVRSSRPSRPRVNWLYHGSLMSLRQTNLSLVRLITNIFWLAVIVRPSRYGAWSCARRRARLVASLRPRA